MKAFIFDLDGTLLDSLADIHEAISRMLTENGYPIVPLDIFPQYFGDGARALVERVIPAQAVVRGEVDARLEDYQRHYAETWKLTTKPFAGIPEVLTELQARGITIAVLSNKPNRFTKLCTAHFLGEYPFATVLGAREGVPRKPDPTAALEIAAELGIAPADCAYVGDSGIDVQMSHRAGMVPVAVRWGFGNQEELQAEAPAFMLSRPEELLDILK